MIEPADTLLAAVLRALRHPWLRRTRAKFTRDWYLTGSAHIAAERLMRNHADRT